MDKSERKRYYEINGYVNKWGDIRDKIIVAQNRNEVIR